MILDRVNLNHLRIFQVVYETKSMTSAAQRLHLTQSGISQHIHSLEGVLGVKLFDRMRMRLVPTQAGETLFRKCRRGLAELEAGLERITEKSNTVRGLVRIGIPLEFGHDVVLPLVGAFQKRHPSVRVQLFVGLAPRLNRRLLVGKLDFAFVDEFIADSRVEVEHLCHEVLELCIAADALADKGEADFQNPDFFESLNYVDYEPGEPLLRLWFQNHFNRRSIPTNIRAHVADAYCVSQLILSGVGAGILPRGLLEKLQRDGKGIKAFSGSGKPLLSGISLATVGGRTLSPAALLLKDFLRQQIQEKGPTRALGSLQLV